MKPVLLAFAVILAVFGVGVGPASSAVVLSSACAHADAGNMDQSGPDWSGQTLEGSWNFGETVTVTVTPVVGAWAPATTIFMEVDSELVTTDAFPGTVSYTFTSGGQASVRVHLDGAGGTFDWSCGNVAPTVSVGSASVVEGDSGKDRSVQFAVTLSEPAITTTKVGYRIQVHGSAEAPHDVAVRSGYVTFRPSPKTGRSPTTLPITAKVAPDVLLEGDETFSVTLTGVTGNALNGSDFELGGSAPELSGSATAVGTIIDDDPVDGLQVSVGDASIWEGDRGRMSTAVNNARVWVNLSEPATTTVSARVTVTAGTATPGSDFKKEFTKVITFNPGQWQRAILIPVLPDLEVEGDETVIVTLSEPTGGLALGRDVGTLTILNDD